MMPGNTVSVLRDGAEAFPAMLEAIAGARRSILLEMYIFASDDTGWRFADALAERARAGVEVAVLSDAVGSFSTDVGLWRALEDAGARHIEFGPLDRWWRPRRLFWSTRDHRKMVVVDGRVGFTGGMNVADEYGPGDDGSPGWRDTVVRVEGPAVSDFTRTFLEVWGQTGGPQLMSPDPGVEIPPAGDVRCGLVGLTSRKRGSRGRRSVYRSYRRAMAAARQRIFLTNPYFLPDRRFLADLHDARRRGVEVSVLVPGRSDVPAVKYASRHLYDRLLRWGVQIHEFHERVLHAKTAVIDGVWCTVGSFNLDPRSAEHNLEVNLSIEDAGIGRQMERIFDEDLERAERVHLSDLKERPLIERLIQAIAYSLRWLL